MKRIARIVTMATLGVVVAGVTAWSQPTPADPATPATTQPQSRPQSQQSPDRDGRGEGRGDGFRDGRERGGGGGGGGDDMRQRGEWSRREMRSDNFEQPDDEEWASIAAFMKKHSPERFARLEDIGDDGRQQSIKNMFAARYRFMKELEERDPELHQIRLQRLPIEDRAFELSWRLMRKQGGSGGKRSTEPDEKTRKELRVLLRQLVKSRLEERALHLQYMQRRLKAEEQRIDELVEANMTDLAEEQLPRDLRPPPFGLRRERRGDDDTGSNPNPNPNPE